MEDDGRESRPSTPVAPLWLNDQRLGLSWRRCRARGRMEYDCGDHGGKAVPCQRQKSDCHIAQKESTDADKNRGTQVILEQDEAGFFVAKCPILKACYTQGRTYEEAIKNIRDAIAICLADLKARGAEIPRQPEIIGVKRIKVAA